MDKIVTIYLQIHVMSLCGQTFTQEPKFFFPVYFYVLLFTTFCYCLYIIIIIITIIASSYIVHIAKNAHNKYKKLIIIN